MILKFVEQINLNFEKHINTDLILIGSKTDFNENFLKDLASNTDIKSIISSESNPLLKSIINEK